MKWHTDFLDIRAYLERRIPKTWEQEKHKIQAVGNCNPTGIQNAANFPVEHSESSIWSTGTWERERERERQRKVSNRLDLVDLLQNFYGLRRSIGNLQDSKMSNTLTQEKFPWDSNPKFHTDSLFRGEGWGVLQLYTANFLAVLTGKWNPSRKSLFQTQVSSKQMDRYSVSLQTIGTEG